MTKLFHDDVLDRLAQKKCDEGCRANLKDAADEVMRTGISNEIIQAMRIAEVRGFLHPDLTLTLVQINQALLFFKADEVSVKEKLTALTPRAKNPVPVPPKVLVKMCALRLKKLVEAFVAHNKNAEAQNKNRAEALAEASAYPNRPPPWAANTAMQVILPIPEELRTIEAVKEILTGAEKYINKWTFREVEKEFAILLAKPELADEHMSAGWDLVLTGQVMSE